MGNQNKSQEKIVILDDFGDRESFNIPVSSKYQFEIFNSFEQFTEMKNVKNIRNIIVRYKIVSVEERMEEIDYHSDMAKVCPMILVNKKSMKQHLFNYLKKLSVNPNVFLFVKDINDVRIEQHQKPYITKIVNNINSVISAIEEGKINSALSIKMNRMAKDMYRKIMVKIIDPKFIKDETLQKNPQKIVDDIKKFKESGISFEYFNSVEKFEKSSISTTIEYVIVKKDQLTEIIDSRKLLQSQFEIILRHPCSEAQSEESEDEGDSFSEAGPNRIKSKRKINQYSVEVEADKKMKIWLIESDLGEIIKKIKNCSSISSDKKPIISENTLICGNDTIYKQNLATIKEKVSGEFLKFNPEFYKKINMKFINYGTSFQAILQQLKKAIYSYVVVFQPGPYLEQLKSFLKINNFDNRVQLTKLPDAEGSNREEIIEKKVKFLVRQINYKIKFQIAPITSIHTYQLEQQRIDFLRQEMGIDTIGINSVKNFLEQYDGQVFQKIIESELIICSVVHFQKDIRPRLKQFRKKTHLARIKYILVGQKGEIHNFIDNPKNYCEELAFVHVSMKAVKNFLDFQRRPAVSIPFFGKGVLSNFHTTSKQLLLEKGIQTMKIKSSVISTNRVLNQIFENKIRISTEYEIGITIFPESKQGMRKVIEGYEEMYLGSLAKLFTINYDILQKKERKRGKVKQSDRAEYINIDILKKDIQFAFKRSKVYELLSVSREDFKEFYLRRIQQSNSLIDLQIACIYTLSLPHGFDKIIAALFNDPRRYQLLNKMFCQFVVVLLTTFYTFHQETIERLELVSYIEEDSFSKKLQSYEPGNIFYNTTFIFCRANSPEVKDVNKSTFIFQFENIEFLQKKKIRNNLYIQPYSFYKQGCEYLIPPQTKFRIIEKNVKSNGYYEIVLEEVEDYQGEPFIGKILSANNITSEKLTNVLKDQVEYLSRDFENNAKKKIKSYTKNEASLYKKAEAMNVLEGTRKLIEQSKKSISSMEFFHSLKQKKYLSAMLILGNALNQIQIKQSLEKGGQLNQKKAQKMMEIELSLLHFKMSEYAVSRKGVQKLFDNLQAEKLESSKWTKQTLQKFKQSIESTLFQRKKLFERMKKTKKWSIEPAISQNAFEFKIKPKTQEWSVNYEPEIQRFNLVKMTKGYDEGKMHYPAEPENEFGSLVTGWINLHPYEPYEEKQIINKVGKPFKKLLENSQDKKNKDIYEAEENLGLKEMDWQVSHFGSQTKVVNNLYEAQLNAGFEETEEWQVFYLGTEIKLVSKKKQHFHKKARKAKLEPVNINKNKLNLETTSQIKEQNNSQFIHTAETLGGQYQKMITPSKDTTVSNLKSETRIDSYEMIGTQSNLGKRQEVEITKHEIPENTAQFILP